MNGLGLRLSRLRLGAAIVLGSAWISKWRCSTLKEEIENLWFVLFLGIEGRRDTFFVLHVQVSSLINQKLDHFIAITIDSVKDWSLILGVSVVEACPEVDELLCRANVTLSNRVIYRSLSILVLSVNNISSLGTQEFDDLGISFTSCIEERRLLKRIFFHGVNTQLDQHIDHPEGKIVVLDDARREDWSLAEVLSLINNCSDINVVSADHANDLIYFALLYLIEDGPVEHTLLAHLLQSCVLSGCHLTFLSDTCNRRLFVLLLVGRLDLSSGWFGDNCLLNLLIFSEGRLYIRVWSSHCRLLLFLGKRRLSLSNFAKARRRISVRIFRTL